MECVWRCGETRFTVKARPLVMGILNITPDSFSDGGRYALAGDAVAHGMRLLDAGADILDVGGESTRPGAEAVPEAQETKRVVPIIGEILRRRPGAVVSVDTTKAGVARAAVAAGARILNDVSAFTHDPDMVAVARESGAGVLLMHMQGTPRTMQHDPVYGDVVAEVTAYLERRVAELTAAGLDPETLAIDPGIGFGKTLEHNLELLAGIDVLRRCGRPVVIGLSRKSFLGRLTGREADARLAGSIAALTFCVLRGAHVMRVHDVAESVDAVRVACALERAGGKRSWTG